MALEFPGEDLMLLLDRHVPIRPAPLVEGLQGSPDSVFRRLALQNLEPSAAFSPVVGEAQEVKGTWRLDGVLTHPPPMFIV